MQYDDNQYPAADQGPPPLPPAMPHKNRMYQQYALAPEPSEKKSYGISAVTAIVAPAAIVGWILSEVTGEPMGKTTIGFLVLSFPIVTIWITLSLMRMVGKSRSKTPSRRAGPQRRHLEDKYWQ